MYRIKGNTGKLVCFEGYILVWGKTQTVYYTMPDKYPRYQVQVFDDLAAELVNNLQGEKKTHLWEVEDISGNNKPA